MRSRNWSARAIAIFPADKNYTYGASAIAVVEIVSITQIPSFSRKPGTSSLVERSTASDSW
ncbi:hypothetical protein H6G20_19930 [Desertifilum sp. FACHB-1129]|uniref:Uncharacterized protein n=1 Tax=Desertifilum tharense IPPAS B-1220 TaxID=1781255 RepID=A0ACD5GQ51_9CYAN|nr:MULTISPECIES: hypothetical protein [Desertifilum]MBD2313942.1 hypothetical protein [Desertifilum sp. FACHB-1129]MBD2324774.1 hypothetical protein [Desertifilum sp. FACHB-866]MBD2334832.1 hypothetical protein [Desertifilum sp. FACHB-868]MDA0210421.1 hypothetical protein [Cyanobacteria bacterium FC1]